MKTITLHNNFHNSEITLHPKNGKLSAGQIKRAQKALCGISGCTCSGELGTRGPQAVAVEKIYGEDERGMSSVVGARIVSA